MTANAGYTELTEICEIDVEFSVILAKTFYIIASTYRNRVIDIFELKMEGEMLFRSSSQYEFCMKINDRPNRLN